jgi:hypothetical protein
MNFGLRFVLGRDYDFYVSFTATCSMPLYHGGQIAMLKSAVAR